MARRSFRREGRARQILIEEGILEYMEEVVEQRIRQSREAMFLFQLMLCDAVLDRMRSSHFSATDNIVAYPLFPRFSSRASQGRQRRHVASVS